MVPPYVQRRVRNTDASVTWWVNDAKMERDRVSKNLTPPNPQRWNDEMHASRLFHVLIGDGDYNMTNTLIAPDWRIWMIDFTRAFRLIKSLDYAKEVTRVESEAVHQPARPEPRGAAGAPGHLADEGGDRCRARPEGSSRARPRSADCVQGRGGVLRAAEGRRAVRHRAPVGRVVRNLLLAVAGRSKQSDAWTLARRTASVNLRTQVTFKQKS